MWTNERGAVERVPAGAVRPQAVFALGDVSKSRRDHTDGQR
jgi:hypothetical protein